MHPQVLQWVERHMPSGAVHVLEFGGADINGTITALIPDGASHTVVDPHPAPNVDVVADGRSYRHPHPVDVVVCTEVAEHCDGWQQLVSNAHANLVAGGCLIFTAAGEGRSPHGMHGAPGPEPDEHYENVTEPELRAAADAFSDVTVDIAGTDIRLVAYR